MPDAERTRRLACKTVESTHASRDRYAEHAGIPCAMVYGLYALSPVSGLDSHRRSRETSRKSLIPASGDQDHTISPSALAAHVLRSLCVHRIPRHVS
jgi:hypothetical protein